MLHLLEGWKEKQLGKMSMIWELGENSLWSRSNAENTLLNLLSISMTEPLIISHWWGESEFNKRQWGLLHSDSLDSSSGWRI